MEFRSSSKRIALCVILAASVLFGVVVWGVFSARLRGRDALAVERETHEIVLLPDGATPESLTADQKLAIEMRGYLDSGDVSRALRQARVLMDSRDAGVRSEVVAVLGWIGKRCLPELAELINDSDDSVAEAALTAWENANEEEFVESVKAANICKAIVRTDNSERINAMLMQMTGVEESVALMALDGFIASNRNTVAALCAKDMFEHISGEIWESSDRTVALIKDLKQRN